MVRYFTVPNQIGILIITQIINVCKYLKKIVWLSGANKNFKIYLLKEQYKSNGICASKGVFINNKRLCKTSLLLTVQKFY